MFCCLTASTARALLRMANAEFGIQVIVKFTISVNAAKGPVLSWRTNAHSSKHTAGSCCLVPSHPLSQRDGSDSLGAMGDQNSTLDGCSNTGWQQSITTRMMTACVVAHLKPKHQSPGNNYTHGYERSCSRLSFHHHPLPSLLIGDGSPGVTCS